MQSHLNYIPGSCKPAGKLLHVDSRGVTEPIENMQLLLQQQNSLIAAQQEQILRIEKKSTTDNANHKGKGLILYTNKIKVKLLASQKDKSSVTPVTKRATWQKTVQTMVKVSLLINKLSLND